MDSIALKKELNIALKKAVVFYQKYKKNFKAINKVQLLFFYDSVRKKGYEEILKSTLNDFFEGKNIFIETEKFELQFINILSSYFAIAVYDFRDKIRSYEIQVKELGGIVNSMEMENVKSQNKSMYVEMENVKAQNKSISVEMENVKAQNKSMYVEMENVKAQNKSMSEKMEKLREENKNKSEEMEKLKIENANKYEEIKIINDQMKKMSEENINIINKLSLRIDELEKKFV